MQEPDEKEEVPPLSFCAFNRHPVVSYQGIIAQFNLHANDRDLDGIPDEWEALYFGGITNANPSDPAASGVHSVKESYIAGLSPIDPDARSEISFEPNGFSWNTISGRVYSVLWTTNLLDSFLPLATNIPWTKNSFTNRGGDSVFYQLTVQLDE